MVDDPVTSHLGGSLQESLDTVVKETVGLPALKNPLESVGLWLLWQMLCFSRQCLHNEESLINSDSADSEPVIIQPQLCLDMSLNPYKQMDWDAEPHC